MGQAALVPSEPERQLCESPGVHEQLRAHLITMAESSRP
jgi:hypothetical protein